MKFFKNELFVSHYLTFEKEGIEFDLFIFERYEKFGPSYEAYFSLHQNGYLTFLIGCLKDRMSYDEFLNVCELNLTENAIECYLHELECIEEYVPDREVEYEE